MILPTGTRVQIFIRSWGPGSSWLNVYITPSFVDWQQTEGLCGTYNGNWRDDLTDRNGNIVDQSDFIKSWGYVVYFYIDNKSLKLKNRLILKFYLLVIA